MSNQTTSRTSALLRGVRTTAAFRQLIPQEAGVGWPLPQRRDGRVQLVLPFFGMPKPKDRGAVPLHPPFATMTIDWKTARVINYRDLVSEGLWETREPVGTFPHDEIAELRRKDYLDRRERLLAMYDEMCARLETHDQFEPNWTAAFSAHFSALVEPSLLPYYTRLSGGFIQRFAA